MDTQELCDSNANQFFHTAYQHNEVQPRPYTINNEWWNANVVTPTKLKERLDSLERAHIELAAMVHARLDRLEAADRANRFGYNGGL